ncbi:MAG: FISUMP domain-containing protein, partial [Bacteroidota bacterium]
GLEVAGGKMKATGTAYWNSPNEGATNESGFSVLPGGYRYFDGSFNFIRNNAFFWSATELDNSNAWNRYLNYNGGIVYVNYSNKSFGASVRCLRNY